MNISCGGKVHFCEAPEFCSITCKFIFQAIFVIAIAATGAQRDAKTNSFENVRIIFQYFVEF